MKKRPSTLAFFAMRGTLAGAALGLLAGIGFFVATGEATPGGILAGAVLGLLYGALLSLVVSLLAGIVTRFFAGRTSWSGTAIIVALAITGLAAPLLIASLLFAGPFDDPLPIAVFILAGLVNGAIGYLYRRRLSSEAQDEA